MAFRIVHRFVRNPNYESDITRRIGNRHSMTNLTQVLKDDHGREIYLIGSLNSSTLLAQRTRKLVQDFAPEEVYVMASKEWWGRAKHLDCQSQAEFNSYSNVLPKHDWQISHNPRNLFFRAKLYTWMAALYINAMMPSSLKLITPGLEMKYALEAGLANKAKLTFGGE